MKKFIKLITLPTLALLLVACQSSTEEQPAESAPAESTEQVSTESTESTESTSGDAESEATEESGAEQGSEESDAAASDNGEGTTEDGESATEDTEEASETAATFAFYVSGEEAPIAEFSVEDAEGLSVLEALESNEDLTFNFNETEGVVDSIEGYENDYTVGNTWTYVYNGEYAQLGVVSQTLEAGDEIDWYYGTIDEIPINVVPE